MKFHWMPFNVAEYKGDTGHLSTFEHGAYVLLILHYWATGGLPDSDEKLARICSCTRAEFRRVKTTLEALFLPGWKHKRIEQELEKARKISGKRSFAAGEKHALAPPPDPAHADASAEQKHTQLPSHLPSQREDRIILSGEAKREARPPPRHGAISTVNGRVYVLRASEEWAAYAEDYRSARGADPNVNKHGGRWFKTLGEGG